jgi:hypothetical protein
VEKALASSRQNLPAIGKFPRGGNRARRRKLRDFNISRWRGACLGIAGRDGCQARAALRSNAMSTSIGASTSAPSYQSLFSQQGVGGAASADPLDQLLQGLAGRSDPPAQTAPAGADAGGSGSPSSAFDPSTFTALLAVQEQAGSRGSAQAGGASNSSDSQSGANGSDSPTTQTVTNPDGSTTTTLTYADGTVEASTTPPVQSVTGTSSPDPSAGNTFANAVQQLEQMLAPIASAALVAAI